MKQKYFIGDREFKTKKSCEEFTRTIIIKLGCCTINKRHTEFNFFNNLIENHPESDLKKGVGIDYFFIIHNPLSPKSYQTMIKRIDGSETDFSWVYCCKFKERTIADYLKMALRTAIKDEVMAFRKKQSKIICNYCKTETAETYHVDHETPTFQMLADNFLKLTTTPLPTDFEDCKIYNFTLFKYEDEHFKNEWIRYHNENSKLQILCQTCNLRKGSKTWIIIFLEI